MGTAITKIGKRGFLVGSHLLTVVLGASVGMLMMKAPLHAAEMQLVRNLWPMVYLQYYHAPSSVTTKRVLRQYIERLKNGSCDMSNVPDARNRILAWTTLSCVETTLGDAALARQALDSAEAICETVKKGGGRRYFTDCRLVKPPCCRDGSPTDCPF